MFSALNSVATELKCTLQKQNNLKTEDDDAPSSLKEIISTTIMVVFSGVDILLYSRQEDCYVILFI